MVDDDNYMLTKTGFFVLSDQLTNVNMNFVNDSYDDFLSLIHVVVV